MSAHPGQAPLPVAASSPAPGPGVPGQDPVLQIRDLSVVYRTPGGDVRAVDQVNLDLAAGEVVGLAGESGSGKSTLVYGACRLLRAPAAKQILQKAGYTMGSNGFFQKGGKTVTLTIVDPSAYTDYAAVDSIVAQELRAAGAADRGAGTDREVRRGEPADYPDHDRLPVVRVQLAELHWLADPGQPLRDRSAVRDERRSRFRHRRGGHPSPGPADLIP
jgi:energy-coupling factor transporter ATP-binding protein EcfA2